MTACSAAIAYRGTDLAERYSAAIQGYCAEPDGDLLAIAYEIAREALNDGFSLADYGEMHHAALQGILERRNDLQKALQAAEEFFLEGATVYDMALRGYQSSVSKLKTEIAERRRIEEELRDITFDLARQRDNLNLEVQKRTAQIRERAVELEKANASLLQTNREQADFTYALSHDLKTPINSIDMFLQTLLEEFSDSIDADAVELIGIASDTAIRMKKLIDDVLEYSRVVENRFQVEPVDLNRLLQKIISDMQAAIVESNARILPDDLPTIHGNAFQLRVLFTNFLSNAIKFRRSGLAPEIRITARACQSGRATRITVADNGLGIRPDRQAHIFDLFKRLHTYDQFEGSGVGLALCKRVADNHGTEIQVTSVEGSGSSFSIILKPHEEVG